MSEYESISNQRKITDVNYDCLEHMGNFLNLEDMLALAQSNKHMKYAVDINFARKYSKLVVRIGACSDTLNKKRFQMVDNHLLISDLKTAAQLIRCFGHQISRL